MFTAIFILTAVLFLIVRRLTDSMIADTNGFNMSLRLIEQSGTLERTSVRGADLAEQVQCFLCTKNMSLRVLQKHMALHQQQLSLFALPPSLEETQDDHVDNDAQSLQDLDGTDEVSDVNDTREAGKSLNLKIPWWIHTQKDHWHLVDDDVEYSTTRQPPSVALQYHNSWTEVLAGWVSEEAIEEMGYSYSELRNEPEPVGRPRGHRFAIEQALMYPQVRILVQRTREILTQRKDFQPVSTNKLTDAGIVAAEAAQPLISEDDARATSSLADEKHSRSNEEQALDVDPPYASADIADSGFQLWPGMHENAAALAKAQRQAEMQSEPFASASEEDLSTPGRPPLAATRDKDDGRLFEIEMVRRVEVTPRGERILPPCDRCRRLHIDCVKNLTACLGCTRKHEKCSWRGMQRNVKLINSDVPSESLDYESAHFASTPSPTASFSPRYDAESPSQSPFRSVGHTPQQIRNSSHIRERTRKNSMESSSAVNLDPPWDRAPIGISSRGYSITAVSPKDRSHDALVLDSLSAAERQQQEETNRKTADEQEKDENARQVRFELNRAEGRAKERSEIRLAEKEKQRAMAREEARRRERQDREDEAAKEPRKQNTSVLVRKSNTQTRRLPKTLTAADFGQMQGESMLAEARERDERSALLRQQQQGPSHYDPRGLDMPGRQLGSARREKVVGNNDSSTPVADLSEWWAAGGDGVPPNRPRMRRSIRQNDVGRTNRTARRPSLIHSPPSDSGSSQSDRGPKASHSNRTVTTSDTNNEIRLRVDNRGAPVSLQISGDMEGRTLQLVPAENGATDLVIGNVRDDVALEDGELQGRVMGDQRRVLGAKRGRRDAEEVEERITLSEGRRRNKAEVREVQDDQASRHHRAPPPVSSPSNFNTRPTSARRPSFSSPENPFAAPPTLSPSVQVHQDPWDARSMRDAVPTTRQTSDGRHTIDRRGADVLSGVSTHSAAREATRAMGRVAGFAHEYETDSEDEPTHGHRLRRH
ncbi:hypothetical protein FB567DRAFT_547347 [Paraphoma chrysanthemicola]|uniref:Zn(2)-C6 fungal-type domain-containing protein n=1 Tax=Paraphoma chrysanthemicola TaxID=798071 RepID=A0A8K0RC55_9PLEO|nr:hypothetical protein FB567DRAFT_547347 [Paraphoma chrysanthemicola]